MEKTNKYIYKFADDSYKTGFFNIFQDTTGAVCLQMDIYYVIFTLDQLGRLNIPVSKLVEFNQKLFLEFYDNGTNKGRIQGILGLGK